MHDWHAYARDHLGPLCLSPADEEQVALELAGHLEEFYAVLRAKGMPDEEAFSEACALAGNWDELRKGIVAAVQEESMHDRIKQIWVPALVTVFSSYLALALLQWAGTRSLLSHSGEPRGVVFYLPWLLLLPLVGAVGGYLSRRAQGEGWRVYLAASFPALVLGGLFLILFSLVFAHNPQGLHTKATALVTMIVGWVVLPGIALCTGVALQGLRKRQSEGR
jgi:hypothetical protein